jgi:hypothetical protein
MLTHSTILMDKVSEDSSRKNTVYSFLRFDITEPINITMGFKAKHLNTYNSGDGHWDVQREGDKRSLATRSIDQITILTP